MRFADHDRYGNGETALARAAESAVADDLRRQLHVGIGQDDDVILCAALALHALAAGRGAPVHMPGHRRRADETDGAYLRMIAKRVDHLAPAINQIHHALGQAGFLEQFERAPHRKRDALGRLEDERVAASDRVRQKPINDHRREIEGRDGRDHTQRLADLDFVHARRYVFQYMALHHHGDAASHFDVLDAAAHLRFGFNEGLSIFGRDNAREFVDIFFEKVF